MGLAFYGTEVGRERLRYVHGTHGGRLGNWTQVLQTATQHFHCQPSKLDSSCTTCVFVPIEYVFKVIQLDPEIM